MTSGNATAHSVRGNVLLTTKGALLSFSISLELGAKIKDYMDPGSPLNKHYVAQMFVGWWQLRTWSRIKPWSSIPRPLAQGSGESRKTTNLLFSHHPGSGKWMHLKVNWYWRDPFFISMIRGMTDNIDTGKFCFPKNRFSWNNSYFEDLLLNLKSR